MEACGSLRLFLGYSYFSEFLFKSGPSRPTGGSCLFRCSLGACPGFMCAVVAGVMGGEREREREEKAGEKDGGGEQKHSRCATVPQPQPG